MNCEKLIEAVRNYNYLYDISDSKYSDSKKKEVAWREIGKKFEQPASLCKKTWNNLREAFRRAIRKKRASKSGDPARKIRKWKYEEEMSFLLPFYQERERLINIAEDMDESSDANEIDEEVDITVDLTHNEYEQNTSNAVAENRTIAPAVRKSSSNNKKKAPVTDASSVLMDYIITNNSNRQEPHTAQKDEVDKFFECMAATVKKLTPINIAVAKSKIFAIVSELELAELHQNSFSNVLTPIQQRTPSGFFPVHQQTQTTRTATSHSYNSSCSSTPIQSPIEDWRNYPKEEIN